MVRLLFWIAILFGVYHFYTGGGIGLGGGKFDTDIPGMLAKEDPVQGRVFGADANPIKIDDFTITPVASFDIRARILSKKAYRGGNEGKLSPFDLALGWGQMSNSVVLNELTITQSNRWYHWKTRDFPIPRRDIETHSGNMHIIPANDNVRDVLKDAKKGQIASIRGYLVNIRKPDGWRWNSSRSRNDTGKGACEIVYAETMSLEDPEEF
jgi:hypothetical protein